MRLGENDGGTSHHVTVREDLIQELGLPEDDLEAVVRESFEFLLERERASSIMTEFSLDVIARYFPEYRQELPPRVVAPRAYVIHRGASTTSRPRSIL